MDSRAIIEQLGGPSAVARLCKDQVTPQAVSQWQDRRIPKGWLQFLKAIHPEVFQESPKPTRKQKARA